MKLKRFGLLNRPERFISIQKTKRKIPMTVCIAAICDNASIIGAADRMITSGDIEFEPKLDSLPKPDSLPPEVSESYNTNQKIFPLTSFSVALTAGDSGLQTQIMGKMISQTYNRLAANPNLWIGVEELANHYIDIFNEIKNKRAAAEVFSPFGLDAKSFIAKQKEMSTDFIAEILARLNRFETNYFGNYGVETIFAGMDKIEKDVFKPSIYTVHKTIAGDSIICNDSVGFSAIGSGSRHAASQFMLAGHSPFSTRDETILLTYLAKKRSEIAPGVGKGEDMFNIGPGAMGRFVMLSNIKDFDLTRINTIYKTLESEQEKAFARGNEEMKKYMTDFIQNRANQKKQQIQQMPPTQSAPPENKGEK